jgi:hypothetical protein
MAYPQAAIDGNSDGRINQNIGYSGAEKNVPPLTRYQNKVSTLFANNNEATL